MAFPLPVEEEVALTGDPALAAAEHSVRPRAGAAGVVACRGSRGPSCWSSSSRACSPRCIAPYDPEALDLGASMQPPWFAGGTSDHILGTDDLGRDVLSRLIYGARVSLLVAIAVVVIAGIVGVTIAVVAGYKGGRLDAFLMRTTDASLAFPVILLAIVIVGVFGASTLNVIIILAVAGWPAYARVLRARCCA